MPVRFRIHDGLEILACSHYAHENMMHEMNMCRRSCDSKSLTRVQLAGLHEQRSTTSRRKGMQGERTEMIEQRIGLLDRLLKST